MHFLIYLGCFAVAVLAHTAFGMLTGIGAGSLILYGSAVFFARKYCKEWDKYKEKKFPQKADPNDLEVVEPEKENYCRQCGASLSENALHCNQCGVKVPEGKK